MLLLCMEMESILRGSFVSLASKGYPNRCHTHLQEIIGEHVADLLGEGRLRRLCWMRCRSFRFWNCHLPQTIQCANDNSPPLSMLGLGLLPDRPRRGSLSALVEITGQNLLAPWRQAKLFRIKQFGRLFPPTRPQS